MQGQEWLIRVTAKSGWSRHALMWCLEETQNPQCRCGTALLQWASGLICTYSPVLCIFFGKTQIGSIENIFPLQEKGSIQPTNHRIFVSWISKPHLIYTAHPFLRELTRYHACTAIKNNPFVAPGLIINSSSYIERKHTCQGELLREPSHLMRQSRDSS